MISRRVPIFVFWALVALVALGAWRLESYERESIEQDNRRALDAIAAELRTRTGEGIRALERMARRWEARGGTPRIEWIADAHWHVEQMDHLQAIEWVDTENIVRWIVPLEGNEAAAGLDLDFEENRRSAAAQARETRRSVSSQPIELVQGEIGFLVFVPIFEGDRFAGFILGVYSLSTMLDRVLANTGLNSIVEIDHQGQSIWKHGARDGEPATVSAVESIDIAGLQLETRVSPRSARGGWLDPGPPQTFAMLGVAIATVLSMVIRVRQRFIGQRERQALDADKLQAEVDARAISEHRLRERFEEVMQRTTDLVGMADGDARTIFLNHAGRELLGFESDEDLSDHLISDYHPPEQARRLMSESVPIAQREGVWSGETDFLSRTGEIIPTLQVLIAHMGSTGEVEFYSTIARDMREIRLAEQESRALELQLHESQRRESMGVLAGGIAHDFNNLLVSVLGYADLALMDVPEGGSVEDGLNQIKTAALRAADLCNQMLAYAGRGAFENGTFDLSEVVEDMQALLRTAVRPGIEVRLELAADPVGVEGDISQIRQIVMNLITNAAESLTDANNRIELRTAVEDLDDADLMALGGGSGVTPGRFSLLEVKDTGCGMDEETRARIFDPFYSTKFSGRGLGLAAVIGIVKRHKGVIHVTSEVGVGTTFTLLLPNAGDLAQRDADRSPVPVRRVPDVSILVVDDEEPVRTLIQRMIAQAGYESVGVASGQAALEYLAKVPDGSTAVILDVTMPGMDGHEAARRIRARFPGAVILLTSGYSSQEARPDESLNDVDGFVQKPYTQAALLAALEKALARKTDSSTGSEPPT